MNGIVCSDIPHTRRIKITDLNPHLMCVLCGGYYIDATTIIECLHSFCKTCIVQYLETSKFCPICDVQVHKTKPLLNIRSDQTLQDIVYKLVPGLFQREMKRRRDFYAKHPQDDHKGSNPRSNEERGEVESDVPRNIFMPDEFISIALEYSESGGISNSPDKDDRKEKSQHVCRHYLRCPVFITVAHLKKLVRAKYNLTTEHRVDILFSQDNLNDGFMLMDIAYMYAWKRKGPLKLFFRIFDRPSKRLKTCHSVVTPLFAWERTRNCNESKNGIRKRVDAPSDNAMSSVSEDTYGDNAKNNEIRPVDDTAKAVVGDDYQATLPSAESQSKSNDAPLPVDHGQNPGNSAVPADAAVLLTMMVSESTAAVSCTAVITASDTPCLTDTSETSHSKETEKEKAIINNGADLRIDGDGTVLKQKADLEEPSRPTATLKEFNISTEKPVPNLSNGEVTDSITLTTATTKNERSVLDKVNGVTTNGSDSISFIQIYSK